MASSYSIYDAKARLSEMLRSVKGGREVTITERGKPIAKVVPFKKAETLEERLKEHAAKGTLIHRRSTGTLPQGLHRPGGLQRFLSERE